MYVYNMTYYLFQKDNVILFIHIYVGFCIARSILVGSAKALNRGTSDGKIPTFFFY